jgi:hypothetical protein
MRWPQSIADTTFAAWCWQLVQGAVAKKPATRHMATAVELFEPRQLLDK